jgi:hypothetical protein
MRRLESKTLTFKYGDVNLEYTVLIFGKYDTPQFYLHDPDSFLIHVERAETIEEGMEKIGDFAVGHFYSNYLKKTS